MTLNPGERFGRYVITEWLGSGGMSDVYRAWDERLQREVALKILAERPGADSQAHARFEREAHALAALNHPNIATLLGTEDHCGVRAIVMEVIEGETVAERLTRGLTLPDALRLARQMALALDAAHQRGIIHRDLKPSNIRIRPDETVKVLDFGLAKVLHREGGGAEVTAATVTLTGPLAAVIGTAAYMSPEQARGAVLDRRTDIWSFGCVLYEMLTGKRAFDGATSSDAIANVINREPDLTALPAGTPASIRRLIRRCLQKKVEDRLRDIGDAGLEIDEALAFDAADADRLPSSGDRGRRRNRGALLTVLAGVATAIAGAIWWLSARPAAPARPVTRFVMAAPPTRPFIAGTPRSSLAISADGSQLAYRSLEGSWGLRVRDQLRTTGVGGAGVFINEPFFSPDGSWLAFFEAADAGMNVQRADLRKVPARGGPATLIASVGPRFLGGSWYSPDTIVFAVAAGVFRVAAAGGQPEVIAVPDKARGEQTLGWPDVLPGGRTALVTVTTAEDEMVATLDLQTGTRRTLLPGGRARFAPTGHLVYSYRGALHAVPFDPRRLEVRGEPVVLIESVTGSDYALSSEGTLGYVSAGQNRELVWVDRQGHEERIPAPPRQYVYPRLSPDGGQVALDVAGPNRDIWIWHLQRQTLTRLTSDPAEDLLPVWSPDSKRVAFGRRTTIANLFWQQADGSGTAELIHPSSVSELPGSFAPDSRHLVFAREARDIFLLSLDGSRHVEPLTASDAVELNAEISPDGQWVAYNSNESGQFEVYMRRLRPIDGAKFQVSKAGGTQPLWSRDQREIFYREPDGALMAVPVAMKPRLALGSAVKLIANASYRGAGGNVGGRTYDVSPDGQRFIMIKTPRAEDETAPDSVVVIENWYEELRRRVPTR